MDSIGNYFYIIIFVIIVVVNILKNLKKKPVATPTPNFPGNSSESREEKDDFWRNSSSPLPPQEPAIQTQQIQNTRQQYVETSFQKNELKEKSTGLFDEKEENRDSVSVTFNDRDDARRAFIYSEIWNRKY